MLLAAALLLAGMPTGQPDPVRAADRRQIIAWCKAPEASPDARNCLDFVYTVANTVDRSRLAMGLRQCVPAAISPETLRRLAARALAAKHPGNYDGAAAILASALIDTFDCTSNRQGRGTVRRPAVSPVPVF